MIAQVLQILVPVGLVAYCLHAARTNIAALCGLPLIIYLGRSAYLDTFAWSFQVGRVFVVWSDVVFAGMLIVWLYIHMRRVKARPPHVGLLAIIAAVFFVYALYEWASTVSGGMGYFGAMLTARSWLYIPFGFFLWSGIFRRLSDEEIDGLIRLLVVSSLPLLALYCLSALNVHVYVLPPHGVVNVAGGTVVRDFLTLSPFATWVLAYFLARPRRSIWWLAAVGLAVLAETLTFSRSMIIPMVGCMVIAALYHLVKARQLSSALEDVLAVVVGLAVMAFAVSVVSPAAKTFLTQRLQQVGQATDSTSTFSYRMNMLDAAVTDVIGPQHRYLGLGAHAFEAMDLTAITSAIGLFNVYDMMWVLVALQLGLVGIVILACLVAVALMQSVWLAWPRRAAASDEEAAADGGDDRSWISLFLLLVMVQLAAVTFFSESFFTTGVVGGLLFALVSARVAEVRATQPAVSMPTASGASLRATMS